ncbi:MAG: tetratricopeptide repeat protein, partial [Chthoniobacterales bacterium]
DPKFWNARFNLAEIPFLEKKWPEARKRFDELLNGNASELQGEATQLIQYKILITHLMEGKDDLVKAMMAKFELNPDTPAVQYANAAIALNKKDDKAAKDALLAAEKNFSPQLNKLFAESLYEVGWLEKPAGQTRAALELNSAAARAAQTKAFAKAKFDEAELALQQRDFTAARKLVDEADAADPNQAAVMNLRGEVFLEQKDYGQAEKQFQTAQKLDPKFRDAQYNLAQIPFKKGEYDKARDRFEALFSTTSGTDKDRAAQLIKFKVYLTYLLEGKDARAQKMMEQFQFTGDTPALYYAQAAWEFKHDNASKANDWVNSARKIYPLSLNGVFADAFFDLGWLQVPTVASSATAVAENAATAASPGSSIEPTPIPGMALAQNAPVSADPLTLAAKTEPAIPGMEATATSTNSASSASNALEAASSPSVETPVASTASPAASQPVAANAPAPETIPPTTATNPTKVAPAAASAVSATPATVLAPAKVREWSEPTLSERMERMGIRNVPIVAILVLAGLLILGSVFFPAFRKRSAERSGGVSNVAALEENSDGPLSQFVTPGRLAGGPPQVSLQLRASEPALRRAVMPLTKSGVAGGTARGVGFGNGHDHVTPLAAAPQPVEAEPVAAPEEDFAPPEEEFVLPAVASYEEEVSEPSATFADEPAAVADESVTYAPSFAEPEAAPESYLAEREWTEPEVDAPAIEQLYAEATTDYEEAEPTAFKSAAEIYPEMEPVADSYAAAPVSPIEENVFAEEEITTESFVEPAAIEEDFAPGEIETAEPAFAATEFTPEEIPAEPTFDVAPAFEAEPVMAEAPAAPVEQIEEDLEPVGQGQPVPYLTAAELGETAPAQPTSETPRRELFAALGAGLAGLGALRHSVSPSSASPDVSDEPTAQQTTTPEIMPQTTQPTPAIRTAPQGSTPAATPQPTGAQPTGQQMPGGMHTAVQLTFSFEISSLQLTPSFKMSALQLKPTSKIVTMRLAPSQQPQPAMNLQVTFEIASVQLSGNSLGVVRLTPSQQQRPGISSSPSFSVAGLQLVAGSEAAPVQITPSQQGQASVHVTAGFNIATVEFSPTFEIASIILNSTSRNVSVQLPGTGPSAVEGAPVFEISGVQLGGNGEIGTMQLQAQGGAAPKRA